MQVAGLLLRNDEEIELSMLNFFHRLSPSPNAGETGAWFIPNQVSPYMQP
jgi:hypothetical protein